MQTNRRSNIEGFFTEQSQRCRALIAEYELLGQDEAKSPAELTDMNVLVLGPRHSGKSSLVLYLLAYRRTLKSALNNRLQEQPRDALASASAIISKTELHARKKYTIEGRSNLYQARRAVNLLQFTEDIEINALSNISSMLGFIDETAMMLCGYKLFQTRVRGTVQAVIVCLKAGEKVGREQGRCLLYLLDEIKAKGFEPLITLTYTEEYIKGLSEQQVIDRLEAEISRMEKQLQQPRQNIHPIQLYTPQAKTALSEQTNYYALMLLTACLKNASNHIRFQLQQQSQRSWLCGCKW